MQDRFKFRVWYKDLYSPEPKPKMIYGAERTYDCFCGDDEQIPASSFGVIIDDEEFIPMQCTGLKDKNGKLLYDGDIIRHHYDYAKVEWNYHHACFMLVFNDGDNREFGEIDMDSKLFEIVGNIHENPELLEQKDVN